MYSKCYSVKVTNDLLNSEIVKVPFAQLWNELQVCHKFPQPGKLCIQRSLSVILLKKFDTFSFLNCAAN